MDDESRWHRRGGLLGQRQRASRRALGSAAGARQPAGDVRRRGASRCDQRLRRPAGCDPRPAMARRHHEDHQGNSVAGGRRTRRRQPARLTALSHQRWPALRPLPLPARPGGFSRQRRAPRGRRLRALPDGHPRQSRTALRRTADRLVCAAGPAAHAAAGDPQPHRVARGRRTAAARRAVQPECVLRRLRPSARLREILACDRDGCEDLQHGLQVVAALRPRDLRHPGGRRQAHPRHRAGPARWLRGVQGPRRPRAAFPTARRARPLYPAHALVHRRHARRDARLPRLPCAAHGDTGGTLHRARTPQRARRTHAAAVGRRHLGQLRALLPADPRQALRRVPPRQRQGPRQVRYDPARRRAGNRYHGSQAVAVQGALHDARRQRVGRAETGGPGRRARPRRLPQRGSAAHLRPARAADHALRHQPPD